MPIRLDRGDDHTFIPALITKPDMRFANTFLDSKYRDYSVLGEAMMDKISGELFIKRPYDGRVLSFFQNKKMIHDLTLELRVMLTNNENIHYPYDNNDAFFVTTNYDLFTINNESQINLLNDDISINSSDTPHIDLFNTLSFNISKDSNGFFCRPTTRDCDKPFIEFLVNKYNTFFENYNGSNPDYIQEQNKFEEIELWKDSSCEIEYIATKYKNNVAIDSITKTHPVRLNENSGVEIPHQFVGDRETRNFDYIKIEIINITFYKVHFMVQNKSIFDSEFQNNYDKLLFEKDDNGIGIVKPAEFSIMHFIDTPTQIKLLGNEFLLAFLDIPYINRYMTKMSKLKAASQFLTTIERPNDIEWGANTCWAERVRDVFEGGISEPNPSPNPFIDIVTQFTPNPNKFIECDIVFNPELIDDFLIIDNDLP